MGSRVTSRPASSIRRRSGVTSPRITRRSVDLPAPFEPITVTKSPSRTSRLTPSRAVTAFGVPTPKRLPTPESLSTGGPSIGPGGSAAPPPDPPSGQATALAHGLSGSHGPPQARHGEGEEQEPGRDQPQVGRREADPQGQGDEQAIDDHADEGGQHPPADRPVTEERLADQDGGSPGHEHADPHADVGEAVVLGDEGTGQ